MIESDSITNKSGTWRIESETGVLREVLMCSPEHFTWLPTCEAAVSSLDNGLPFDHQRAMDQHRQLCSRISESGAVIRWLDTVKTLPDLCWTRDSSHMTPWGALITRLSESVRAGEHREVETFYHDAGHTVWHNIDRGNIEGGDIHFISPGMAVVGYSGVRTTREGAEQLANWVKHEGWEVRLQLVDSKFVHLDVVFCMAAEGLAVVCEEVLGPEFTSWLNGRGIQYISVSADEAMKLGCNLLALGNERVIVPEHCTKIRKQLRAEGLDVITVELDMFTLGGGGVHCLTQPLNRAPST
jgi:N-dimethylarginine dimethylaminohydrolase